MRGRGLQHREPRRERARGAAHRSRHARGQAEEDAVQHRHRPVGAQMEHEEQRQDGAGARRGQGSPEPQGAEQRARRLGGRVRQHVQIEEEERENRDEVDEPLQDDRGKSGRGCEGVVARDQVGADDLAGARDDQPRHEAHQRHREEPHEGHASQRGQEIAPTPCPRHIGHERGRDDSGQEQGIGGPERGQKRRPVHAPEEQQEQTQGEEGPHGEPAVSGAHAGRPCNPLLLMYLLKRRHFTTMGARASNHNGVP